MAKRPSFYPVFYYIKRQMRTVPEKSRKSKKYRIMSMNTNPSGQSGNSEFDHLFEFENEGDQLSSDTRLLSFGFLSELERHSDQSKGLKKRLAAMIGTSASFITQLFNGDKIISLETVA